MIGVVMNLKNQLAFSVNIKTKSIRTLVLTTLVSFSPGLHLSMVKAETVTKPESFMPAEMIAAPGETKNNSLTTGTRAVLSFGTSTTFGSNVNVSGSAGYKTAAQSQITPTTGSITSSFGGGTGSGTDRGVVTAVVGNIRSAGSGTFSGDNFSLESDDTSAAEGSATMTGVETAISLDIDKNSSTSVEINPSDNAADNDIIHTANGAANNNLSNNIDVNVSNSTFHNEFSQAF